MRWAAPPSTDDCKKNVKEDSRSDATKKRREDGEEARARKSLKLTQFFKKCTLPDCAGGDCERGSALRSSAGNEQGESESERSNAGKFDTPPDSVGARDAAPDGLSPLVPLSLATRSASARDTCGKEDLKNGIPRRARRLGADSTPKRKRRGPRLCPHGRRKDKCQDCGGSGICQHRRRKVTCKNCGGNGICEHGKVKGRCRRCGGASFCGHGRLKDPCKECGGSRICPHGRQKQQCKECGGSGICPHGKRRYVCTECGGAGVCLHGRLKEACKECGGSSFCVHGKRRSLCRPCGGYGLCSTLPGLETPDELASPDRLLSFIVGLTRPLFLGRSDHNVGAQGRALLRKKRCRLPAALKFFSANKNEAWGTTPLRRPRRNMTRHAPETNTHTLRRPRWPCGRMDIGL